MGFIVCMKKSLFYSMFFLIFTIYISYSNDSLSNIIDIQAQKFRVLLETISKEYYKENVDLVGIAENAYNSLLQSLDKFSSYYSATQYKSIKDAYKGSGRGIGVNFFRRGDTIIVFMIVKGSPAEQMGLQLGDKVIYVNHDYCIGKDINYLNKRIQESSNDTVILTVKRDNFLKEFVLPVAEIEVPSVVTKMKLEGNLGYVRILRFSLKTYSELISALDSLLKVGSKSLVIDLRGNQGGYLDEVIRISKEFLSEGDTVVLVFGNKDNRKVHICESNGKYRKIPVIILVDENTASGGEVFASCMQDNDRAIVIGTRTFGKGLVQRTWEFKDGSAFRLTTGEYLSPLGRTIQKEDLGKLDFDKNIDANLTEEQKEKLKEMINQFGATQRVKTFFTNKGRLLLGGGGVFPDYFFMTDTLPTFLKKIKSSGFLNDFVLQHFIENKVNFMTIVKYSLSDFITNFKISDNTLGEFRRYLILRNVMNETQFNIEFDKIVLEMKATLGYLLFGDSGYYSVIVLNDKIITKAKELKIEAENLLK